jgi:hypothetical protein
LILSFILFLINVRAQSWEWATGIPGTNVTTGDEGISAATDQQGSIFVTGYFSSPTITFGTYTLTNQGFTDIYIAKYDANGNVLWAKGIGGTDYEQGLSVTTDKNGDVYLTGFFSSAALVFSTYTLTTTAPASGYLAKYNSSGALQWVKKIGGAGYDFSQSVTSDEANNVYLTGRMSSSSMTIGTYTLINSGGANIFIAKFDSNGNVKWATRAGGTSTDLSYSIANKNNVLYITGNSDSPQLIFQQDTVINNNGNPVCFIAKYDTSGNSIWAKAMAGTSTGNCVSADSLNNVIITGDFNSTYLILGTDTLYNDGPSGTNDIFIAKYNSTGNVSWAKSMGGSANWDIGWSVATDKSSNIYFMAGFTSPSIILNSDTIYSPNGAPDPMFLVKYDPLGNILCYSTLASGGDDISGLATDNFGNVFFCGDYEYVNPFVVGNYTLTPGAQNAESILVAKFNCDLTGIPELSNQLSVKVYPNPANDILNLEYPVCDCTVKITDVLSNTITEEQISNKISINSLPNGIYFLAISDKTGQQSIKRIIVNH